MALFTIQANLGVKAAMQNGEGALMLDVSTLGHRFRTDMNVDYEKGLPIIVFARKPSTDATALAGFLRPLQTLRDDRSDWRAMLDAWRLRHFAACFGLADRSGYRWGIEDTAARISVIFDQVEQKR